MYSNSNHRAQIMEAFGVKTHYTEVKSKQQNAGLNLVETLLVRGYAVDTHDPIPYGYLIKLNCGLVIVTYDSGKVLVRGNFKFEAYGYPCFKAIVRLLPDQTKWALGENRDSQYARSLQSERRQAAKVNRGTAVRRT